MCVHYDIIKMTTCKASLVLLAGFYLAHAFALPRDGDNDPVLDHNKAWTNSDKSE